MSKSLAKTGAALAALAAGFVVLSAGPASAEPASCGDFRTILSYYESIGDYATADALRDNMESAGCDVERRLIA